MNLNFPRVALW